MIYIYGDFLHFSILSLQMFTQRSNINKHSIRKDEMFLLWSEIFDDFRTKIFEFRKYSMREKSDIHYRFRRNFGTFLLSFFFGLPPSCLTNLCVFIYSSQRKKKNRAYLHNNQLVPNNLHDEPHVYFPLHWWFDRSEWS